MNYYVIVLCFLLICKQSSTWKFSRIPPLFYPKEVRETSFLATTKSETSIEKKSLFPSWLPSFGTASLGGFMFGLDIGSSSSVLRILGEGSTSLGQLNSFQLGEIASASLFGAIISSILIIFIGDKSIGRKLELNVAAIAFIIGTVIQSSSTDFIPEIFGRLVYGLGIGVAMHVAPLFIAETSPSNLRGKLISFKEAAIVGGIVAGYAFGAIFGESANWQAVFQSALPFEGLMLAGAITASESPRWLALRNRKEEAILSIQKIQDLSLPEAELAVDEMVVLSQSSKPISGSTSVSDEPDNALLKLQEILNSKYNRRALLIGIGLVLFQQLSGQPSVLYFANRIFEQAGLGFQAAVGVGLFKLVMTSISAALVENPNFGRKSLLLYGNIGITISLLLLSYLYGIQGHDSQVISDVAANGGLLQSQLGIIAAMFLFVGSYQIGFGPITWLILSEIFPLRVRSGAVSLGTLANFSSNLLITLIFESERQLLGESLLFLQFGVIGLLSVLFTSFYVFETRGLSLEEIEMKLKEEVDSKQ
eukprot:gene15673-17580_t